MLINIHFQSGWVSVRVEGIPNEILEIVFVKLERLVLAYKPFSALGMQSIPPHTRDHFILKKPEVTCPLSHSFSEPQTKEPLTSSPDFLPFTLIPFRNLLICPEVDSGWEELRERG